MRPLELLQSSIARALPERLFDIRISEDAEEKFSTLRNKARIYPTLHFALYFNHDAFGDPALWAWSARKIDTNRRAAVLASKWHTNFHNNPAFASIARFAEVFAGIRIIPTIQKYQVDDPKYGYTDKDARMNQREIIRTIQKMRRRPMILLISPEGHRSEDENGALGKAEDGVVDLGSMLTPLVYVPISVRYERPYRRDSLNNWLTQRPPPPAHIEIGRTTEQTDRRHKPPIQDLMHELALTLPRNMRGQW